MYWEISSRQIVIIFSLAVLIFFILIAIVKYILHTRLLPGQLANSNAASSKSNKYPEIDVFGYRQSVLAISFIVVIGFMYIIFNWTLYGGKIQEIRYDLNIEEELEVLPPRTQAKRKTLPPPSKIETLVEEQWEEQNEKLLEEPKKIESQPNGADEKRTIEENSEPVPLPDHFQDEPEVPEIFKRVEQMPRFPGCEDKPTEEEKKACAEKKLIEFIYENISYPADARGKRIEGLVVVQFVVDKDGTISNMKVVRNIGAGTGEEALRVVKLMNEMGKTWTPGKQRGRPVRVQFNLPIRFKLQ